MSIEANVEGVLIPEASPAVFVVEPADAIPDATFPLWDNHFEVNQDYRTITYTIPHLIETSPTRWITRNSM